MEKEILETFEAARKAADAAAGGGGMPEEERCLEALRRLMKMPVTVSDLVGTQIGRRLRALTKHSHEKIQAAASELLKIWKSIVITETKKPEKITSPQAVKIDDFLRSESFKSEKSTSVKARNADITANFDTVMNEADSNEEKSLHVSDKANGVTPPRPTVLVKCNDAARDRFREVLADALSKVAKETNESEREEVRCLIDEVDACDPICVAITVESVMFEKFGSPTTAHKIKYRSIMFNLKDSKNTDFRRRVLLGHVKPEKLVEMTPEDMASDERRAENQQIKERALHECELGAAPKATTDQFRCGRCGQRKCTYYQMQTRSADEPMTTFVTCVNCNHHWKFC
ncbi:hypothetical protein AXF42_Ash008619 [Apostasia shenzhenica]|uniref:Transcription elongation factor n=1 Tax=Apostasia shenzhenica TaxID=1088818 RepID=A0A2I0B1X4_9ASPA|nr:hypothetical protein AXF42_Ash008619 [Apostasia shenzhenica]